MVCSAWSVHHSRWLWPDTVRKFSRYQSENYSSTLAEARTTSTSTRETLVVARAIHAASGVGDAAARTTAIVARSTLATIVANHAAVGAVCSTNLPAYVFARPTSAAAGIAFVAARSTLATARPIG